MTSSPIRTSVFADTLTIYAAKMLKGIIYDVNSKDILTFLNDYKQKNFAE